MSEIEKKAAERLQEVIPKLNDYNKGRLIGIGEGIAIALDNEKAKEAEPNEP